MEWSTAIPFGKIQAMVGLAILQDGSFKIIYEDEISADPLVKDGVVNLLAFGLLGLKMEKLPSIPTQGRAIYDVKSTDSGGIIDENHYIITSCQTGRTSESEGYLCQLAEVMKSYGV